jgi:hypothetical protein
MNSNLKKIIAVNLVLWLTAIVATPLVQAIPTSTGEPAKIFSLLVPLFQLMLAGGSTYMLKTAAEAPQKTV